MMDPKLAAILKKSKSVQEAVNIKDGGNRPQTRNNPTNVDRGYFDQPDVDYLTQPPQQQSGGGLFDQIPGMGGSSGGGQVSTPTSVDRMSVDSPVYENSVKESNLPPEVIQAMLNNRIPQPNGIQETPQEFIDQINPTMLNEDMEREPSYDHPITPDVKPREIPRTQPKVESVSKSGIRKMIAEEISKALPTIIEDYFEKRMIKENVQFKAGETTFSGTVSPLPKKRTKIRK